LKDLERLIDVAEVAGVQFQTVDSGAFDLTSASGKMMASHPRLRRSTRVRASLRAPPAANLQRALSGAWRREGSRPFGFNNDGTHREPEATMVRTTVKDILGGKSLHAVAREWNATGVSTVRGVPWTNLHVRRVLTNARTTPSAGVLRIARSPGRTNRFVG
jgi:hypothetical protein